MASDDYLITPGSITDMDMAPPSTPRGTDTPVGVLVAWLLEIEREHHHDEGEEEEAGHVQEREDDGEGGGGGGGGGGGEGEGEGNYVYDTGHTDDHDDGSAFADRSKFSDFSDRDESEEEEEDTRLFEGVEESDTGGHEGRVPTHH